MAFNSLLNDNILDLSKAFADNNQNVAIMANFLSERIENIVGKGEFGGYQHFFPFPQCFFTAPVLELLEAASESVFTNHSQKHSLSFSPRFSRFVCNVSYVTFKSC